MRCREQQQDAAQLIKLLLQQHSCVSHPTLVREFVLVLFCLTPSRLAAGAACGVLIVVQFAVDLFGCERCRMLCNVDVLWIWKQKL